LGGDEFGVICRPVESTEQGALAERILAGVAEPITLDGRELTVSASVGVVDTSTAGAATDVLMRAADISLYMAKARGRGRWERHDPLHNARQVARHTLATEMAAALAHGEFLLEYQPLVSLQDGEVRRVEALLRWRHPRLGLLQTDDFVPIAEDNDLITPLGLWVLQDASRQASEWYRRFPEAGVGVNVNVSVRQLRDPSFADEVRTVLAGSGLPPQLLHLELTESAVLGDAHGPLDVLEDVAAAGVRLAIDDFGTGYSNLAHLGRLPVSELKLAGSFLAATPSEDQANLKIIPAVISLAHSLGLTVTAEGVETAQQANRLRALSCDQAQGWFFGRPVAAEEISRILAAARPQPSPDGVQAF
jgi:EAL domain-containing protein (putative c-di-GMP-specific phosphodiesterase class I)